MKGEGHRVCRDKDAVALEEIQGTGCTSFPSDTATAVGDKKAVEAVGICLVFCKNSVFCVQKHSLDDEIFTS